MVDLAGSVSRIAERARQFVLGGNPVEALYLLDIALAGAPDSLLAREVKCEALALLLSQSGGKNLWERMWIGAEIRKAQAVSDTAGTMSSEEGAW